MKQSLHLGVRQQLKMTPQLQQAIRLLQLSSLELQQEIQENLYTNPLLEVDEDSAPVSEDEAQPTAIDRHENSAENLAPTDFELPSHRKDSGHDFEGDMGFDTAAEQDLPEYLLWQLDMATMSDTDRLIGRAIIDAIDGDGFLGLELAQIVDTFSGELDIGLDECEAVLHCIQHFDPIGIAARDLRESLLIQMKSLDSHTPHLLTAEILVGRYLPLISKGDLTALSRQTRKSEQDILGALALLQTLSPRPGNQYAPIKTDYIIPDVVVARHRERWVVTINPETLPKIRLSGEYKNYVDAAPDADRQYLRDKMQEAKWFMRSLDSRHDTLLKVATAIVHKQVGFFEQGPEQMQPLILRDLAEELGFHESTISRATNQKYLSCPSGVFELKYFFSSQVATTDGGEASSTAIKAVIAKLVQDENPQKPLSDSKLAAQLKQRDLIVARRTVAKYREMLGILSSSERKRIH